jgi:transposase-like protein
MARPKGSGSKYTDEIADAICFHIANGGSLREICRELNIDPSTPLLWLNSHEHPAFNQQYTQARASQADVHFDEMLEDENAVRSGKLEPMAARAIIDSKKWRLARMSPKKYGDRQEIAHTGANGGPVEIGVMDLKGIPDEQLIQLLKGNKA